MKKEMGEKAPFWRFFVVLLPPPHISTVVCVALTHFFPKYASQGKDQSNKINQRLDLHICLLSIEVSTSIDLQLEWWQHKFKADSGFVCSIN